MKLSAKSEYACLALLELSLCHGSGEPVRIRQISESHDIPFRFLVQILLQLKAAGLVNSTRGASGGYQLARPPEEITLADVITVFEGEGTLCSSLASHAPPADVLRHQWREIGDLQRTRLEEVTFSELVERTEELSAAMYHI